MYFSLYSVLHILHFLNKLLKLQKEGKYGTCCQVYYHGIQSYREMSRVLSKDIYKELQEHKTGSKEF